MMKYLQPWRRSIRRAGMAVGIVFTLSVIDIFVTGHLAGKDTLRVVAGTREAISGDLVLPVRRPDQVRFLFDIPGLNLNVVEVRGRFWRGELTVPAGASEGIYTLNTIIDGKPDPAAPPTCRVTVYPSAAALRAAAPSLIQRYLGIAPWWMVAGSAPLLLVSLALTFLLAGDREAALAAAGLSPIVKLARRKDHWEVAAPLVSDSIAVASGDDLAVVDRRLHPVARMVVTGTENGMVTGRVDSGATVVPDGYIRLPADAPVQAAGEKNGLDGK